MNWLAGQEHLLEYVSNELPWKHLSHEVALLHMWQFPGQSWQRFPWKKVPAEQGMQLRVFVSKTVRPAHFSHEVPSVHAWQFKGHYWH